MESGGKAPRNETEVSDQPHVSAINTLGKNPFSHWTRGSVGSISGLNVMEERQIFVLAGNQTRDVQPELITLLAELLETLLILSYVGVTQTT